MPHYVVESHDFTVVHGSQTSQGVVGEYKGKEKIYLHVLSLPDVEIKALKPRVDDDGNVEHARLALPRNQEWWIAVEGEVAWPRIVRPRIVSRCEVVGNVPTPLPLTPEELARLGKGGSPS
jgi:hypothetical protein